MILLCLLWYIYMLVILTELNAVGYLPASGAFQAVTDRQKPRLTASGKILW